MPRIFNKTPFLTPSPTTSAAGNAGMGTPDLSVGWGDNSSINNPGGVSQPIYVEGHEWINWYFTLTDKNGNPETLLVIPEVSEVGHPNASADSIENWSILQQRKTTYQAAVPPKPARAIIECFDYVIEKSGISLFGTGTPILPGTGLYPNFPYRFLSVSIPVKGFRWMRVNVCCRGPGVNNTVYGYARYTLSGGPA